jgi:hypothetical protein
LNQTTKKKAVEEKVKKDHDEKWNYKVRSRKAREQQQWLYNTSLLVEDGRRVSILSWLRDINANIFSPAGRRTRWIGSVRIALNKLNETSIRSKQLAIPRII